MRHSRGLAASPRVRYTLKEGRGLRGPFFLAPGIRTGVRLLSWDGLERRAVDLGRDGAGAHQQAASRRVSPARAGRRRRRQPGLVAQARESTSRPRPSAGVSPSVPYAELHAHSAYSFLDGASTPEELVEEAARLESARHRADRSRRALRRGPVRRGGQGTRRADGVRRRTVAGQRGAHRGCPTRRGRTCWCWPAGPRATDGCRASWPRRTWPAGRRASPATTTTR